MANDHRRTSAGVTTRRRCSPRRVAEITAPSRPSRVGVPVRLTKTRPRRADGSAEHDHNDPAAAIRRAGSATTRQSACGVQAEAWASPGPASNRREWRQLIWASSVSWPGAGWGLAGWPAGTAARSADAAVLPPENSHVPGKPCSRATIRRVSRGRWPSGWPGPGAWSAMPGPSTPRSFQACGAPPAPARSRPQPAVRGDPVPVGGSASGRRRPGGRPP